MPSSFQKLDNARSQAISDQQASFYEFIKNHPQGLERSSFKSLVRPQGDLRLQKFLSHMVPIQPWPMFLDEGQFAELGSLSVTAFDLARSLPERLFGNDAERMCEFYGLAPEVAPLLKRVLELPWRRGGEPMRGDFVLSKNTFVCLEVNATGNAGGIFNHQVVNACMQDPLLQQFISEQQVVVRFRDPWRHLLMMMIERAVERGLHRKGRLDLGITMNEPGIYGPALPIIEPQYRELLGQLAPDVDGQIVFCHTDGVVRRGDELLVEDVPLQIVLQGQQNYGDVLVSAEPNTLLAAWLDGVIDLYPGPLNWIYSDKRNLALMSAGVDSGDFSRDETRWIEKHFPWTRLVQPGRTSFHGESVEMEKLLVSERQNLVLKPAQSASGVGIFLGRHTDPSEWQELLRSAFEYSGTYIVQERIDSDLQLHQWGDSGCEFCDINWGLFVAGHRFGGAYLRLCPPPADGIVNVGNGAQDGCVLELLPADQEIVETPAVVLNLSGV